MTFGMPRQFAASDLLFTRLLAGDIGGAQSAWPALWEGAEHATAWTTWLIAGRLAVARAEIALEAETADVAAEWAQHSLAIARRTLRKKYEARSLAVLGRALAGLRRREEAFAALRGAVQVSDELIGAPARWQARADLGEAAYSFGDDATAATAYREASDLVEGFVATLAPERAARVRSSPTVEAIMSATGRSGTG
jgi:hypothetical protein